MTLAQVGLSGRKLEREKKNGGEHPIKKGGKELYKRNTALW